MRGILAILAAGAVVGCVAIPPAAESPASVTVNASSDAVWEAALLELAARGLPLANTDREDGLLITTSIALPPEAEIDRRRDLADCGTLGGVPRFPSRVTYSVTVKDAGERASVRAWGVYLSQLHGEPLAVPCASSGAWEGLFIAAVRTRAEGLP